MPSLTPRGCETYHYSYLPSGEKITVFIVEPSYSSQPSADEMIHVWVPVSEIRTSLSLERAKELMQKPQLVADQFALSDNDAEKMSLALRRVVEWWKTQEVSAAAASESKHKKKLIRRIDPRKLNPDDCCFIFSAFKGRTTFRIYDRKNNSFVDYEIATCVTPFVQIVGDDVELKEYIDEKGEIHRWMDFPEYALSCGKIPMLGPGEIWEAETKDKDG